LRHGKRVLPFVIPCGAPFDFCDVILLIGAQAPHQATDSRTWNLLPVASA
jgi:hypothetical protein